MSTVSLTTPRKAPKQERSRATVDAILEATAQVLVECGYDKASTKVIAHRAGVSIGSLYQYFPNKEALITALGDRHIEGVMRHIVGQFSTAADLPLRPALRVIIEGLLAHHAIDPAVHQVLIAQIPRISGLEQMLEIDRMIVQMITAHLRARAERLRPRNIDLAVFILVHAVQGVTHAAVLERPETLETEEMTEEMTDLVARYLLEDALEPAE